MSMSPTNERSRGRGLFWLGLLACLLGPALAAAQFALLQRLDIPWYSPALASIGALMLLLSAAKRPTIPRVLFLVFTAAFAGFQWYAVTTLMKLPEYQGPIAAGKSIPPFTSTFADGKPFSEADLRDGSRRMMVFFRGKW
jgi:hypothetical protein